MKAKSIWKGIRMILIVLAVVLLYELIGIFRHMRGSRKYPGGQNVIPI